MDIVSLQNSVSSFRKDLCLELFSIMFLISSRFQNEPKTYTEFTESVGDINLFQLKGQDLVLSNDLHVFLQMTYVSHFEFDIIVTFQHVSALH